MHPTIAQAVAAERVREWRDQAARDRLAAKAPRARGRTKRAGLERAELPAGRNRRPRDQAVADELPGVTGDRQPVGHRAA